MASDPADIFVEVLLPLPLAGTFTYRLPLAMRQQVAVGSRVIVPFGRKKFYTGIVSAITPIEPREYEVKEVIHVLDAHPVVRHPQIRFWQWVAEYYLCTVGEVYKAAVPTGLKIESETLFEANPDFEPEDLPSLRERELLLLQMLQSKGKMSAKELEKESGFRNIAAHMSRLIELGAVIVSESLVNKYRAKKVKYVRLSLAKGDEEGLRRAFEAVKGAKKQESLLLTLIHMSNFTIQGKEIAEVEYTALLERSGVTAAIVKALIDKGIIERYTKEVSRFDYNGAVHSTLPVLSEAQGSALSAIHKSYFEKNITLLRGVTSSGKTELYIHLIDYVMKQGLQVLYLVPEIALTTQLTSRLQAVFGADVIIYHSRFSDNERVDIWNRLLGSSRPCVVIGARSSIFLPFAKLGLVIVDEEHDPSYKQYDPAPRYNGRDAAIMLAYMHGAKTLLGSATPSVETYYKATTGKYGLVELLERFEGAELPEIELVDLAKASKQRAVSGSFALSTVSAVRHTVDDGAQAIIFHNRRGYAPLARCTKCQYIPKCLYCDVSLTYHRRANHLVCHYCGATYPLPQVCPVCKEPAIEIVGYGTERIEDETEELFPSARILRMDLDTTRSKDSYETLIAQFSQHKADILVGTQMVTKGLDFGDVNLVAIINADAVINYPDFRSAERAYNMLEQVSGRAGRRDKPGKVMLQTRTPDHPVISFVEKHDYAGFYAKEIEERRLYNYPPFTRLIYIVLKHRDERELDNLATIYADRLRSLLGNRISGPAKPGIARIQSLYIRQIMLKVELGASMKRVKEILRDLYIDLHAKLPAMKGLQVHYDVDPY